MRTALFRTNKFLKVPTTSSTALRAAPILTSGIPSQSAPHSKLLTPAFSRLTVRASASDTTATATAPESESDMKPKPTTTTLDDPRLQALRDHMAAANGGHGVAAFIVPSEDPHMSEYAPKCHARREWLSNFTGSAGTVVITQDAALLWTDGRYFLQAEQELPEGWTLMRSGTPGVLEIADWLAAQLPEGASVGIDPFLHTLEGARKLETALTRAGKQLVPLVEEGNLVDRVWGAERPAAPADPLRIHAFAHAGESVEDKILRMRAKFAAAGAGALLVTMLDETAWLFNLRGTDVAYNPVFLSYAIITSEACMLYVEQGKVNAEVAAHLQAAGVEVRPYSQMVPDVRALAATGTRLMLDPAKVSLALAEAAMSAFEEATAVRVSGKKRKSMDVGEAAAEEAAMPREHVLVEGMSPVVIAKAVKNAAELQGMKEAHLRDGVALAEFFCWLEETVRAGKPLTEVDVGEVLLQHRRKQAGFVEPSFPTIAGSGPNGAIIHYRAHEGPMNRPVDTTQMLLIDSGGQYECGTTDVTRTVHFGTPSEHERRCFTAVLKGHIALDQAVFPEGTPGFMLDSFARQALWKLGLNYRHGTGHGVGAALNVHEGPMSISPRFNITYPLSEGMVVSNEPGYYEDGAFGIRIENLVSVRSAETPFKFANQAYFTFERLTMHPIQRALIATEMLSADEVAWLNNYHSQVWESLHGRIADEKVKAWLKGHCAPIAVAK